VLFGDPYRRMTEENGDGFDRHPFLEQIDGERVAVHVSMAFDPSQSVQLSQSPLPVSYGGLRISKARPEEIIPILVPPPDFIDELC